MKNLSKYEGIPCEQHPYDLNIASVYYTIEKKWKEEQKLYNISESAPTLDQFLSQLKHEIESYCRFEKMDAEYFFTPNFNYVIIPSNHPYYQRALAITLIFYDTLRIKKFLSFQKTIYKGEQFATTFSISLEHFIYKIIKEISPLITTPALEIIMDWLEKNQDTETTLTINEGTGIIDQTYIQTNIENNTSIVPPAVTPSVQPVQEKPTKKKKKKKKIISKKNSSETESNIDEKILQEHIKSANEILKPFSGFWNNLIIMKAEEFKEMIDDVIYMIKNDKRPNPIHKIGYTSVSTEFISKTFSILHNSLYGSKKRFYWIEYLKEKFKQFEKTEIVTINKTFKTYRRNYDLDIKNKISYPSEN